MTSLPSYSVRGCPRPSMSGDRDRTPTYPSRYILAARFRYRRADISPPATAEHIRQNPHNVFGTVAATARWLRWRCHVN